MGGAKNIPRQESTPKSNEARVSPTKSKGQRLCVFISENESIEEAIEDALQTGYGTIANNRMCNSTERS